MIYKLVDFNEIKNEWKTCLIFMLIWQNVIDMDSRMVLELGMVLAILMVNVGIKAS